MQFFRNHIGVGDPAYLPRGGGHADRRSAIPFFVSCSWNELCGCVWIMVQALTKSLFSVREFAACQFYSNAYLEDNLFTTSAVFPQVSGINGMQLRSVWLTRRLRPRIAWPILLIVSAFVMNAKAANAGIMPVEKTSIEYFSHSEEFRVAWASKLFDLNQPDWERGLEPPIGADAATSSLPGSAELPTLAFKRPPPDEIHFTGGSCGGFSSSWSSRSSKGSSAEGWSGGIFAALTRSPMPLLAYWQRVREFCFTPPAPLFEVFRPPPSSTIAV